MLASKRQRLSGWGRTPVQECRAFRPEKQADLAHIIRAQQHILARGLGRSYGDAALQPEGVILTERLNHFMEFDSKKGMVRAQAGVTLAEIMEQSIPRGWFPPVLPGTRHVTIGGALACNVHGKNHYRQGDFAEHIQSFRLIVASGEMLTCSPTNNRDLFWATAGGMGMTGIIQDITLKLNPLASSSLSATTYRVDSLEDMVAAFEHYRDDTDYMVGWIDHMARDEDLGRGIFEAASHIDTVRGGKELYAYRPEKPRISVPFSMPNMLLNRHSMGLYNKWRFKKYSAWRQAEIIDFNSFFHPLDRIAHWNRLYGKRGFYQYQCLFPESPDVVAQMQTFLSAITRKKIFSFLAVIKYHRAGKGLLTFSQEGYSIALDFPNTPAVRAILPQLDHWVADHGGRVYLAKDALLTADLFHAMYGQNAAEWLSIVRDYDPDSKFTSLMSQRLEWK